LKRTVQVFIEGGGDGNSRQHSNFRQGWSKFLSELRTIAQSNGYDALKIIRGGGRGRAFKSFKNHRKSLPNDLCVLLVDSETLAPITTNVWDIVKNRKGDGWEKPNWANEKHLYLMAHMVETWLLTDQEALQAFFRNGFNANPLPTTDLENRPTQDINRALQAATKNAQRGAYRHGQSHEIIELVRPERVKTLPHGNRLFEKMEELLKT